MFKDNKIFYIILIIFIFVLITYIYRNYGSNAENFKNESNGLKWKVNKSCPYEISKTIIDIMDECNIKRSDDNNSDILIQCVYDDINKEINNQQKANL